MKYYIIGYTFNEYLIGDVLVPKKVYTEEEKARGKKNYTEISEETFTALKTNKIFNALEAGKKLRVLDKLPGWAVSGGEREAQLKEQLAASETEKQSIIDEAQTTIADLRKQIADLKKE